MGTLSLLVFTRNDIAKLEKVSKALSPVADEIVVVDSSDAPRRKALDALKKKNKKMRSYYAIALGYPDPLRMYALKKCKSDWILLLDTDERLSGQLMRDIRPLISGAACNGFAIKRYEEEERKGSYTWQIRLFKRGSATFKGLRHEQAEITGGLERLSLPEHAIVHIKETKGATSAESANMHMYDERLSYELYNKEFLNNISKFLMPSGKIEDTKTGKLVSALLYIYEALGMKGPEKELSSFDYFAFGMMRDFGYVMKGRTISTMPAVARFQSERVKVIKRWKSTPEGKEAFEISKIINRIGIIRFLELDRESTIARLNSKYKDKEGGITLLIKLLVEQYRRKKGITQLTPNKR